MEIECLVCGYIGEPKKVSPLIKQHWLYGLAEIDKVCPTCGDTALEEVSTGKSSVVFHKVKREKWRSKDGF